MEKLSLKLFCLFLPSAQSWDDHKWWSRSLLSHGTFCQYCCTGRNLVYDMVEDAEAGEEDSDSSHGEG